jgi:hypothetical protein
MNTMTTMYADAESVIREGWDTLVEQMGIHKATQFIMLIERGKGDSVQEIADFWGDASIDEINDRITEWKKIETDLED